MDTRDVGSPPSQERSVPIVLVVAIAAVVAAFGYTAAPGAAAAEGAPQPAAHSPAAPQADEAMSWKLPPPGRPQVECALPALPPGHPPVDGGRALPPGHPPVGGRAMGLPPGHPPVHARPGPAVVIERADSLWI